MSKQVIVYPCPYCSDLIYYDNPQDLGFHIYKHHLKQALKIIAESCKELAKQKNMKWCLK